MSVTLQSQSLMHFKFFVSKETPLLVNVNTLSGEIEYEITTDKPNDQEFGLESDSRNTKVVHRGNTENGKYVIDKDSPHFKKHRMYYLTLKSKDFYSRVVVTVGHVGDYTLISEATPQSVTIDGNISSYYYLLSPEIGNSKIVMEVFPSNRDEKFSVYTKIVRFII